jgi:hypothetical protein
MRLPDLDQQNGPKTLRGPRPIAKRGEGRDPRAVPKRDT